MSEPDSAAAPQPKPRNRLVFLLKAVVSLSIIAFFLMKQTSLDKVLEELGHASPFWLAIAFSLHGIGLLISALRWQILIKAQGDSVPLGFLVQSYLVGMFFNNFLPSRIGGDVVRIWDGSKYSRSLVKSSAIVVVERLTGIIVLLFFALAASLIRLGQARQFPIIWIALGLGLLGLVCIGIFLTRIGSLLLSFIPEKGGLKKAKAKILTFRETILNYRHSKGRFFKALSLAFLLQVNVIIYYHFIGKAISLDIPFLDYFIFIPIYHLVLLIPITINGVGMREIYLTPVLGFYGYTAASSMSFAWIDLGFIILIGLIGGLVFLLRKK